MKKEKVWKEVQRVLTPLHQEGARMQLPWLFYSLIDFILLKIILLR